MYGKTLNCFSNISSPLSGSGFYIGRVNVLDNDSSIITVKVSQLAPVVLSNNVIIPKHQPIEHIQPETN